jgi:hypothetical protein
MIRDLVGLQRRMNDGTTERRNREQEMEMELEMALAC